ncbi:amidohydrolase family protein [Heliophilum fasciatum]|uniref:Amidohydrolase-related domain-containing protein n=1 Tax=Heliophilum fasciatum TaxID=35700 RepID=A0A4R2RZ62_9FIRM|nr:amidohydrolase family protein [Heliophilum fasciatum]MCW2276751.1 putative TIM-barrel fold metal-dependent hydrolase [Heliophilum fasciatum]TCP68868.1 hypothetical protein EDD73_10129 [Heliophilum fasciatum]
MIIDAHAHISDTDYGSAALYQEQMDIAGISGAVFVPGGMMDVRRMTDYVTGKRGPENIIPDNATVASAVAANPAMLRGFACVDPHEPEAAEELARLFAEGFRGLKLSPMSHQFSFGSNAVAELVQVCWQYRCPVYSHVVYSPGASTARFAQLARENPQVSFILGHMGFGPADREAVEAANELPNLYLETSTGNLIHLQNALDQLGPGKLIFGSEFPLSNPLVELAKIHMLRIAGSGIDQILGDNIRSLLQWS